MSGSTPAGGPGGAATTLESQVPEGFRFRTTVFSHGWMQLAPFSWDPEAGALERVQALGDGELVRLRFTDGSHGSIRVEAAPPVGPKAEHEIADIARRIFQLDLALTGFHDRLRGEERYAWVEKAGAGWLLRSPTVWEDLVKTLLTTNTTWASTRKMVERVVALGPGDEAARAFPSPERIASMDPDELHGRIRAGYRSASLHRLASDIAEGSVDVEAWAATPRTSSLYDRVTSLHGFGPYAAGNVLKLLGEHHELALDTAARSMFADEFRGGKPATDREIREHYAPYGEWQGLVIWMDLLGKWIGDEVIG